MDSQVLIEELGRLRDGVPGAESRVLFVLGRSNLFLLAADSVTDMGGSQVVVRVRFFDLDGRRTAYLFSSEESLSQWCAQQGVTPNALPIHGGDVELLLPKDAWVQLDPGTPHVTNLSPGQLSLVNGDAEVALGVLAKPGGEGFVSAAPKDGASSAPQLYQPVEMDNADGPAKRKFIPRSHPTTLFSAPAVEKKEPLKPRERTYTSSNLKKVIRSIREEEGEE